MTRGKLPQTVEVTLLFSDVVGSTELTERLGDRQAYELIRRFCDVTHEWTLLCGGEALELRGDGALVAFPTPRDALVCAAAVQRSCSRDGRLAIRTGVHAGPALRVSEGYFGRTVIAAVRIATSARPGEVLISSDLVDRLADRREFQVGAPRSMHLKGFASPFRVYTLEREDDLRCEPRLEFPSFLSPIPGPGLGSSGQPGSLNEPRFAGAWNASETSPCELR
jgi:class 3 adenylate cyclase